MCSGFRLTKLSEMIIFESILTTFDAAFEPGQTGNWLKPKTKPLLQILPKSVICTVSRILTW